MVRQINKRSIVFENVVIKVKPQLVFSKKIPFEKFQTELRLKEVIKVEYEIVPEKRLLDIRI